MSATDSPAYASDADLSEAGLVYSHYMRMLRDGAESPEPVLTELLAMAEIR